MSLFSYIILEFATDFTYQSGTWMDIHYKWKCMDIHYLFICFVMETHNFLQYWNLFWISLVLLLLSLHMWQIKRRKYRAHLWPIAFRITYFLAEITCFENIVLFVMGIHYKFCNGFPLLINIPKWGSCWVITKIMVFHYNHI